MKIKQKILIDMVLMWTLFVIACQAKERTVAPGKSIKTYTPSGVYADVYVDPGHSDESLITLSSDESGVIQVRNYFDGVILRKILIQGDKGGLMLNFANENMDSDSISVVMTHKNEDTTSVVRYKLVPIKDKKINK